MWELVSTELSAGFATVPAPVAALRLGAALVLGGILGAEREHRHKPAGLRTHMLIAMAACLFILIGQDMVARPFAEEGVTRTDPLRLIQAVTAGVAFLAAGTIISSDGTVRNLTTGASMWLAGAIGLACGLGHLSLAAMAAIIAVIVLVVLRWVENRIGAR